MSCGVLFIQLRYNFKVLSNHVQKLHIAQYGDIILSVFLDVLQTAAQYTAPFVDEVANCLMSRRSWIYILFSVWIELVRKNIFFLNSTVAV